MKKYLFLVMTLVLVSCTDQMMVDEAECDPEIEAAVVLALVDAEEIGFPLDQDLQ